MAHHQAIAAGVTIRPAQADDLDTIKALADAERAALGFVRRPALAEAITHGEMLAAERAGEVVGFVEFHRRRDGQVTLYSSGKMYYSIEPANGPMSYVRCGATVIARSAWPCSAISRASDAEP